MAKFSGHLLTLKKFQNYAWFTKLWDLAADCLRDAGLYLCVQ